MRHRLPKAEVRGFEPLPIARSCRRRYESVRGFPVDKIFSTLRFLLGCKKILFVFGYYQSVCTPVKSLARREALSQ
ncbi:hypothetical protein V1264_003196 [Littorina saxatilis]|uniref:Uncharacterized protein n=1 Tax=Littorina saxatilis TaxID=31220 RepID=A0AAN9G810_9CAEN